MNMNIIAKQLKQNWDNYHPDLLTEEGLETLSHIDVTELGGCCGGHWADENMMPMEEEEDEEDY